MCRFILLFILPIILLSATCNDSLKSNDDPKTHQNILDFKVNGVDWIGGSGGGTFGGPSPLNVYFEELNGRLGISTFSREEDDYYFSFVVDSLKIGEKRKVKYQNLSFSDLKLTNSDCIEFNPDTIDVDMNFIILENVNYDEKLIEGRFEFRLMDACHDVIELTEGYFHLAPYWN